MAASNEGPDLEAIKRRIFEIAPSLHTAGTFPARTFDAILRHAAQKAIRNSAETGSGASTLLFSHLERESHPGSRLMTTPVALSTSTVPVVPRPRRYLRRRPTQQTLPRHRFTEKLQFALIDEPAPTRSPISNTTSSTCISIPTLF